MIAENSRRANPTVTSSSARTSVAPVPNTFTFSPPAESEWLPLFASANGLDGFLRWAYHSWVENPLVSTDFTSWPSGDCFLVYPGDRSSIRFERLRELDTILADFTWERGQHTGPHADDVRRANQAVLNATRVMMK